MSTPPRRLLGTGPSSTRTTTSTGPVPRLLPVERADVDHQEHVDPRPRSAGGPLPGRRALGDRGQ
ncbi:hypothetical protein ACFFKE_11495 [Streptomyces mutabilis]|uniref:hypothetical protein n=1 Tax=Streptomyces mutabilis TaxID=67332 RepID=UPI00177EB154|nr:hypothetical protein [Streptomyces mutabilis]